MKFDYRPFIGRPYTPPHGCFTLVQQVFEQAYGLVLADHAAGLAARDMAARALRFHQSLATHCVSVTNPAEGDLIVLNIGAKPAHIGIVTAPGWMLHAYAGGSAVIEGYTNMCWRNRIDGFYRYAD